MGGVSCCASRDSNASGSSAVVGPSVMKLKKAGLHDTGLIIGIDFTISNNYNGIISFGGLPLHKIFEDSTMNFYEQVIDTVGRTLWEINQDKIPTFVFGDIDTTDDKVKPLNLKPYSGPNEEIKDISSVLQSYREVAPVISMFAPRSLKPLIGAAISIQKKKGSFQTLLAIVDGAVANPAENIAIIEEAAKYPLAIVVIGVGDGDDGWAPMQQMSEEIQRKGHKHFHFSHYSPAATSTDFVNNSLAFLPQHYLDCNRKKLI